MQVVFKLYRLLHRLNYQFNINLLEGYAQNLVNVELGQSAKLVRYQLVDLPVCWKQVLVLFLCFFACTPEPSESPLGVVKGGVWLAWRKQLFVGIKHKLAVPTSQIIQGLSANRIHN